MDNPWLMEYVFPNVGGKIILLVGLGGGCDIISAYAVSKLAQLRSARSVIYGNTKRRADKALEFVSAHIQRVPPVQLKLSRSVHTYGTTLIDQSVPRGDDGCPLIFVLPEEATGEAQLAEEIRSLGYDLVVAVDTGGDSIAEEATSGRLGRDKRMLDWLQRTGMPLVHMVIAPGSDGETSYKDLKRSLEREVQRGRWKGSFSLMPLIAVFKELGRALEPDRTPNIIVVAAEHCPEGSGEERFMVVPRGIRPAMPCMWLTRGFVFS